MGCCDARSQTERFAGLHHFGIVPASRHPAELCDAVLERLLASQQSAMGGSSSRTLETVPRVDVPKLMGAWFVIATMPTPFYIVEK